MTREKQYQVEVVKKFVDTIHQYQWATNNSLFWGSPRHGVSRMSLPEFDLVVDRSYARGVRYEDKPSYDKWKIEISSPNLLVAVHATSPISMWITWEDLSTRSQVKWTVETVGDVNCLSEAITWLKLNWPI